MNGPQRTTPTVSVVIPVYNLDRYIDACLDSVRAQSFPDFEAIVVDDGSTDGSWAAIGRHAAADRRIVPIHQANSGVVLARRAAIEQARGRYITFLDGDDVWMPDMLERMVAAIEEDAGCDIVCCNYKRLGAGYEAPVRMPFVGQLSGREYLEALLCSKIWGGLCVKFYRRTLFEQPIVHHPLRLWEDLLLNLQIACYGPRVRCIDYVGYGYLQRGGSLNHSRLDFAHCVRFCELAEQELLRHDARLGGDAERCILLNHFRIYMIYLGKTSNAWQGRSPLAQRLRALADRYPGELRRHFPRRQLWMAWLDRYAVARPLVLLLATLQRWQIVLSRRLAR